MTPINDGPNEYAARLHDAILDRSSLTDNLADDEADLLIEWALRQADRVSLLITNDEDYDSRRSVLMALVKQITRIVTRRHEQDDLWLGEKLNQIGEYSQQLGGPSLNVEQWRELVGHASKSNTELVQQIVKSLTASGDDES